MTFAKSTKSIEEHIQNLPYDLNTRIELMTLAKQDFSLREPSRFERLLGINDPILPDIEDPHSRKEIAFRELAIRIHNTNPAYEELELSKELNILDTYYHNEPVKYDECLQCLIHAQFCEMGFRSF